MTTFSQCLRLIDKEPQGTTHDINIVSDFLILRCVGMDTGTFPKTLVRAWGGGEGVVYFIVSGCVQYE